MENFETNTTSGIKDSGHPKESYHLRGNMGTIELLFTVLAFTAPLGVIYGYLSYNFAFGIAVPLAFIVVACFILLFALGFTRMSRSIPRPGAFYTYIATGLGKKVGLGGAYLAVASYAFNLMSTIVFSGIIVNNFITNFGGPADFPWWGGSAIMFLIVWFMSYFNVELSAKVLSTALVLELIGILIFDFTILKNTPAENFTLAPWKFDNLMTPSAGLMLLFGVGLFNGFEATAIYRDEVKNPEKTIPRATYLTVILIGALYAISSYSMILSSGVDKIVDIAQKQPTSIMSTAVSQNFGAIASQIVAVLLMTSVFASMLSLQNILSRYVHSLSVDGIFSKKLAKVHPKHGSPYCAALFTGAVISAIAVFIAFSGFDSTLLYGAAAGLAFYGMLLLLLLTSFAVIRYFTVTNSNFSIFATRIAPAVSVLGFIYVVVTATLNIDILIPTSRDLGIILVALLYMTFAVGFYMAWSLKKKNAIIYKQIGRNTA
ncbi:MULTISPECIES: APC family permease [Klebsiella/Raoultella group]|uniref:APC family permease n=1 Tax=Klebsiella/Raoultella group TaxID=2890311 RepID=UPI0015A74B3F|nr:MULTISPECIES: APC family permease [Klebsiella/Raoultella group]